MNINTRAINHLKAMSAATINKANSGHTGTALGASTILYSLFKDHYFFNNSDPYFFARDRFILSAGHASALYYSLLNMFDMGIDEEDLKNFRRLGSNTPGHPEFGVTPSVEVTTGPLGQGVANAVGMAIGQAMLGERFNVRSMKIINNYTYCFCGDGCLMEGVAQEALSLAGTLKLNKLIILYDKNDITIDGSLNIANREDTAKKYKAMGFNIIKVNNGNNYFSVTNAIAKAKKSNKPTMIIFKTIIGLGTEKEGTSAIHGTPLNDEELIKFLNKMEVVDPFNIPGEIKEYCNRTARENRIKLEKWNRNYCIYQQTHPDLYKKMIAFLENKKFDPLNLLKPEFLNTAMSGRDANSVILKEIASKMPRFVGGTADLAPSVKAYLDEKGDFSVEDRRGMNIHYGVREHAMGAISNGLCLYLNSPVFCSTFMSFSNYMIPAIRMSAMMNLPVYYIFTHDSFYVGEDGPTHQPVEQIPMLRLIPNLKVFRPADSNEILCSYKLALSESEPCVFAIAKQKLTPLNSDNKDIIKGGYVVSEGKGGVSIFASGSEVSLALEVKKLLEEEKIACEVCSFPCLSIFDKQPGQYKNGILNANKLRVVIEATNDNVWYKYINSSDDLLINVKTFGKSSNTKDLEKHFGFLANNIAKKIKLKLNEKN